VEGDFAFPCFKIAKDFRKNPAELAKETAEKMNNLLTKEENENQLFEQFIAVGPYVNAIIKKEILAKTIIQTVNEKKSDYGR
jgi:arginyl-tRNA synthetase